MSGSSLKGNQRAYWALMPCFWAEKETCWTKQSNFNTGMAKSEDKKAFWMKIEKLEEDDLWIGDAEVTSMQNNVLLNMKFPELYKPTFAWNKQTENINASHLSAIRYSLIAFQTARLGSGRILLKETVIPQHAPTWRIMSQAGLMLELSNFYTARRMLAKEVIHLKK